MNHVNLEHSNRKSSDINYTKKGWRQPITYCLFTLVKVIPLPLLQIAKILHKENRQSGQRYLACSIHWCFPWITSLFSHGSWIRTMNAPPSARRAKKAAVAAYAWWRFICCFVFCTRLNRSLVWYIWTYWINISSASEVGNGYLSLGVFFESIVVFKVYCHLSVYTFRTSR